MTPNYRIILGSKSPRRKELLQQIGWPFIQVDINADESYPRKTPYNQVAEFIAIKKANTYQKNLKNDELLITADTVVCLDEIILEKPKDTDEAFIMLSKLSSRTHLVITGVCLTTPKLQESFSVQTNVTFKSLREEEINHYIKNYGPFDKAGAYGIQEWIGFIGVEKIEGSYTNVVGLPLFELYQNVTTL